MRCDLVTEAAPRGRDRDQDRDRDREGKDSGRPTILTLKGSARSTTNGFARAVRAGLLAEPKTLPWPYFYDARGSELFERICDLPEYYLTRTEDAILRTHAASMVAVPEWSASRPTGRAMPAMVELGSGSSVKTRRLIAAALEAFGTLDYVPIDVSATALEGAAEALARRFPGLRVTGFVADYQTALAAAVSRLDDAGGGPRLFVFLGSSLGNYEMDAAIGLLSQVAGLMRPEDRLLLGTDLAKDRSILEAAYDDAEGVTARFNLNILMRINRELQGGFDLDRFVHRAVYRPDRERVEMHLVSRAAQVVRIDAAELTIPFEADESIHTESSHKYSLERLNDLARRAGFAEEASWTDRAGWFRVQRWRLS